jgi:hypothetical protein
MYSIRSVSTRRSDDFHDSLCYIRHICVAGNQRFLAFQDRVAEALIWTEVVGSRSCAVLRASRMSEVICAGCERTWHDNGSLDSPAA